MTSNLDRTRRHLVISEASALLARTPGTLDAWLRGLPECWLVAHEGGDTWSPIDIVGHLIHGERTDWMARVRGVVDPGASVAFERFDRFAQFRESAGKSLPDLLDEFARLREANLRQLAALQIDETALARP